MNEKQAVGAGERLFESPYASESKGEGLGWGWGGMVVEEKKREFFFEAGEKLSLETLAR